ncbi:MAG: polyprenyl synthetase family protein [Campylobacteraceae bacterium]|nr:polyprenyl synthetase family protein [Campylobacteraceae bacterium]
MEQITEIMNSFVTALDNSGEITYFYKNVPEGKRLRAKLILKIAKTSHEALKLAAIIEMIHAASLLHDDVIDDADTRRGEDSFNAKFGSKSAIMMGDILYSVAFSKLTELPNSAAKCVSNAVALLSAGELTDVKLSDSFNTDKNRYMDMIYRKTASLIEASAKSAAILEGLDGNDFAVYGKNLGLAFQIIDDVLDIISDEKTLGKPALHDFKEGKVTLPYLYLYEKCSEKEREQLSALYKKELNAENILWIKERMSKYGAIERSIREAKELGYEALRAIEKYKIDGLKEIITQMIERDF